MFERNYNHAFAVYYKTESGDSYLELIETPFIFPEFINDFIKEFTDIEYCSSFLVETLGDDGSILKEIVGQIMEGYLV